MHAPVATGPRSAGTHLSRWAERRPLLFVAGCLLLYAGYGWVGQTAKALGSRWGDVGAESLAAVLAILILTGLGWWRRAEAFRTRYGVYGAIIYSSLMFSLLHLANLVSGAPVEAVVMQLVATLLFGLVFAGLRLRTGSMWVPVMLHAANNFFVWVGPSAGEGAAPPALLLAVVTVVLLAYGVALVWGMGKRSAAQLS